MKFKIISINIIVILIFMILYMPISNASTNLSDNELLIMNGKTITKTTTVKEISDMFGQAKIEGNSAFGGNAYKVS